MDEKKSRADFYIFGLAGWSGLVWGDLLRFGMIWNDLGQLRWKPGLGSPWGGPQPEPKIEDFKCKFDLKWTRKSPGLIFTFLAWLAGLGQSAVI